MHRLSPALLLTYQVVLRVVVELGRLHFRLQPSARPLPHHASLPSWHYDMLADKLRNTAYDEAIRWKHCLRGAGRICQSVDYHAVGHQCLCVCATHLHVWRTALCESFVLSGVCHAASRSDSGSERQGPIDCHPGARSGSICTTPEGVCQYQI